MSRVTRRNLLASLPAAAAVAAPAETSAAAAPPNRARLVKEAVLACTQLGFRPKSPKTVSLCVPQELAAQLPAEIPVYLVPAGYRLPRTHKTPAAWSKSVYQWPFDIVSDPYAQPVDGLRKLSAWSGNLRKTDSRWGPVWQADFTGFEKPGLWQLETEFQFTCPFAIEEDVYLKLQRGYLLYLEGQRAGAEVPGVRPVTNADDAVLDSDGTYIPASGGWFDAGDLRKWMALTSFHHEALTEFAAYAHPSFHHRIREEMVWGNRWTQAMMNGEGRVYEDIGGGDQRGGQTYEEGWWTENHPGCIAGNQGNRYTDNAPGTGDERKIRTTYNPWCQYAFVREQAMISRVLPPTDAVKCRHLAERAWDYAHKTGHDRRTMFVAAELRAALELHATGLQKVIPADMGALADELMARQDKGAEGLSGYFVEKGETDGYRSVGFSCEPALSLLRLAELAPKGVDADIVKRADESVRNYIERYLLADAKSNPFAICPYGVFIRKPNADQQTFRDAGRGRGVRTFIHPFNDQFMVHGTNSVLMHQAHLLARAGKRYSEPRYAAQAERHFQWCTGHNPTGLSMFTGVGYRTQTAFSIRCNKIPEGVTAGFAGRPDDSPYLETSNVLQWSTQEVWGVPFIHAMCALGYMR